MSHAAKLDVQVEAPHLTAPISKEESVSNPAQLAGASEVPVKWPPLPKVKGYPDSEYAPASQATAWKSSTWTRAETKNLDAAGRTPSVARVQALDDAGQP